MPSGRRQRQPRWNPDGKTPSSAPPPKFADSDAAYRRDIPAGLRCWRFDALARPPVCLATGVSAELQRHQAWLAERLVPRAQEAANVAALRWQRHPHGRLIGAASPVLRRILAGGSALAGAGLTRLRLFTASQGVLAGVGLTRLRLFPASRGALAGVGLTRLRLFPASQGALAGVGLTRLRLFPASQGVLAGVGLTRLRLFPASVGCGS